MEATGFGSIVEKVWEVRTSTPGLFYDFCFLRVNSADSAYVGYVIMVWVARLTASVSGGAIAGSPKWERGRFFS